MSASDLDRLEHCPGSEALPHVGEISGAADRGTFKHEFMDNVAKLGIDEALARAPEETRELYAATDLDRLGVAAGAFAGEVAYAWDPATDTARELGRNLDRRYIEAGLLEGEEPGTVDAVAVAGNRVIVIDWKSGWRRVRPAAHNRQVHFAVVAAVRALASAGVIQATGAIGYVPDGGRPVFDVVDFSPIGVDQLAGELQEIKARAAAASPDQLNIGEHCRYCPAFRHCPAQRALLRMLVDDPAPAFPAETPRELVGEVWDRLDIAEQRLKQIRVAARAYAEQAQVAVPLSGGRELRRVQVRGRPSYDAPGVKRFMATKYGPAIADLAMVQKTDASKFKKALRKWHAMNPGAGKITHLEDELVADLTRIGAIKRGMKWDVRAVPAGAPAGELALDAADEGGEAEP